MKKIIPISLIIIFIDQIVKIAINNFISLNEEIKVIPNFFSILYVRNNGAAFSILQNSQILLIIFSIIALYIIYIFLIKNKQLNKISILSISLLIGGIIGNMLDRIIRGYVIDYLSFFKFPVFNIADICIVIGCLLLILILIKEDKNANNHKQRK